MKKLRSWLIALCFTALMCACACLVACRGAGDDNTGGDEPIGGDPIVLGTPAVTVYGDGLAAWEAIENASGYVVKIGENEEQTTATSARLENGQAISVKAVGGTAYSDSGYSSPKTYKAPTGSFDAPQNLAVAIEGTDKGKVVLSWDEVDGAGGYEYIINDDATDATAVDGASVTVDLGAIDEDKLDSEWSFRVRALGTVSQGIAEDGDYSARRHASDYCVAVEFSIDNGEIYTVADILKIMNYYGEKLPIRDFMVAGTISSNADGDAVLENGFTLFGNFVHELDLALDGSLVGLDVTAMGRLTLYGGVKGLSSYFAVDFEDISDSDRYALAVEALYAWDMLKEDSKIRGDFLLPVKLYGVNILWTVDDDDTGAFTVGEFGAVTVACPADGEDDIPVMLTAALYIDIEDDRIYTGSEPTFMFAITQDNRIQLAAPKINIDPKTGVATWNKIEHAMGYRVEYYGFSVPGDYYSEYVSEEITIDAEGERAVTIKDTWWISVRALGDGVTYKDSEVDPKQYNYYPETVEPDGTPLAFDMTRLTQTGTLANPDYIFGLACGNSSVFQSASASRVTLGNDDSNGAVTGTGFIKVGSASNDGKITLNFGKRITGVVITARQWNKNQNDKISVNGSAQQTASKDDWGIMYFNFTAANATTTVEIDTDNRVFIQSIVVYVEE